MNQAVLYEGTVPEELKMLVSLIASQAAGCRYCQAHTGHTAERLGVAEEKLAAVWEFETSEHFDDAERAALRLAFHAGQVPNAATDEDFVEAGRHFSDDQVAAIVAVCSLFGYLNRWNDTMATTLESHPMSVAQESVAVVGWTPGKHAATPREAESDSESVSESGGTAL